MDETKKYILQCEKAVKIQALREKYYWEGDYYTGTNGIVRLSSWRVNVMDGWVWLPRQDQLQEMINIEGCGGKVHYLCSSLYRYFDNDERISLESMEQLWLAFVMFKKHNKRWDGNDWIKTKEPKCT